MLSLHFMQIIINFIIIEAYEYHFELFIMTKQHIQKGKKANKNLN